MSSDAQPPWVILRLRQGLRNLWANYEDSSCQRRLAPLGSELAPDWPLNWVPVPGGAFLALHLPLDFEQLISQRLAELPQTGPTRFVSMPVAVFFEPPTYSTISDWPSILAALPPLNDQRIQLVRLTNFGPTTRLRPRLFELPLRILALSERYRSTLENLLQHSWYADNLDVQRYGLSVTWANASQARRKLKDENWDIVLTDQKSVTQTVLHTQERRARRSYPGLSVFIGSTEDRDYVYGLNLPAGAAFLWIPDLQDQGMAPNASAFLTDFLYGIIHDYPLHQAFKLASPSNFLPSLLPLLIADPLSNDSLRLSSALPQLLARADCIRPWHRLGNIQRFLWRTGDEIKLNLRDTLIELDQSRTTIQDAISIVKKTPQLVTYDHETEGLVHLASAAAALSTADVAHSNIETAAAAINTVPELTAAFEQYQERYVDIAVQERDGNAEFRPVNTARPLRQHGTYHVRVNIGHQAPDSVMIGDVPPLDPLLPAADEGYQLEVALFEKDFQALSPTLQKLYLPRLGRSEPVYFEVRAPESKGVAEARIGIYYENNLVQSFLLKTNVDSDPTEQPEPIKLKLFVITDEEDDTDRRVGGKWINFESDRQVLSALAFTQSVRLNNLSNFGRRELSIAINDDMASGNHTFMLKLDGEAKGLPVKDKTLSDQTDAFRDLLKANTHDANNNPIFETYPSPADAAKPNFLDLIQRLIEMGSKLYQFIYENLPAVMRTKLSDLAEQSDKTIQVVRLDIRNVFPWQIIYDYQLPTKIAGAPSPQICLGYESAFTEPGKTPYPLKKCSHGPFDEVYCLSGFWGLRHQIEQLFKLPSEKTDTINKIVPASMDSFIKLAVSTGDDPAKRLSDGLTTEIGAAFVNSASSPDLLDLMWNDSTRPAVLVVMGHLENQQIIGEPIEDRIVLVPKKKWFLASTILKRLQKAKGQSWKQPNTLVLLMACSSGATEITTLNNFVTNLNSAGAAAVVGTECLVFSSLVGRCAREIISDLWQHRTLGEAVKFFNRRLVSAGNPLAFVFNSLGSADLELIRPNP
jgi:hypothetical protein